MDDDDPPQLSAEALAALQEFYAERALEEQAAQDPTSVESKMPEEDWQLSQFWYDELTSEMLAKEALAVAGSTGRIACLSCPTMYNKLRQIKPETCSAVILEYDQRFSKYGEDFIFYDYNNPLDLPKELESSFDIVVADPPFLSEECLKKTAKTISFLSKGKILLCTGGTMEDLAFSVLNVKVCTFQPKHSRNLANEFKCYTNYSPLVLGSA